MKPIEGFNSHAVAHAMALVKDDPKIRAPTRYALVVIAKHLNAKTGTWCLSQQTIADEAGCAYKSVQRYVDQLEEAGYLIPKADPDFNDTYRFQIPGYPPDQTDGLLKERGQNGQHTHNSLIERDKEDRKEDSKREKEKYSIGIKGFEYVGQNDQAKADVANYRANLEFMLEEKRPWLDRTEDPHDTYRLEIQIQELERQLAALNAASEGGGH